MTTERITVYLTEDQLRAVLAVVAPIVSGDLNVSDDLIGAETELDSALLEHETGTTS